MALQCVLYQMLTFRDIIEHPQYKNSLKKCFSHILQRVSENRISYLFLEAVWNKFQTAS